MKIILRISVCALLAALTGLAISTIQLVRTTTAVMSTLPDEVSATRAALLNEVQAARKDVLGRSERQMAALRRDAMAEADEIRQTADRRVGETLAKADAALNTAEDLRRDVQPVIEAAQVTLRDTDRTVADLHPQLLGLDTATAQFSGVATNLNRLTKPKWYDRLLGYGLNGVVIYRNLNPVTSLTVRGVQFLTSH
jgi:hypothetical protein